MMADPKNLKLEEDIIGYKAAFIIVKDKDLPTYYWTKPVIIKLKIPKGAYATPGYFNPFSAFTSFQSYPYRKRRCSMAIVQEIWSYKMKYQYKKAIGHSVWDVDFVYSVGSVVDPKNGFSFNVDEPCASGIHFFDTIEEVQHYISDHYVGLCQMQSILKCLYEKDKQLRKEPYNEMIVNHI